MTRMSLDEGWKFMVAVMYVPELRDRVLALLGPDDAKVARLLWRLDTSYMFGTTIEDQEDVRRVAGVVATAIISALTAYAADKAGRGHFLNVTG